MTDPIRTRADARLDDALRRAAVQDPRPFYRPALRHLKERNEHAFRRALRHHEDTLLPAVSEGADPLAAWLDYGRVLADELGAGRYIEVDPTGRADPADAAHTAAGGRGLLLYLPDDAAVPALVLRCPADATPAQNASIDLLVLGRVSVRS